MTITASPGCALTSLIQPIAGNAQCTGNYVETIGLCQFTALSESFPATCDTSNNCVLTYPGGTSHALVCNGQPQSYTSPLDGISFSGSCTCVLSAGATAPASSSAPAAATSAPAVASSAQPAAATVTVVKSSGTKIGKSQGLFIIGFVFSMLVSMA